MGGREDEETGRKNKDAVRAGRGIGPSCRRTLASVLPGAGPAPLLRRCIKGQTFRRALSQSRMDSPSLDLGHPDCLFSWCQLEHLKLSLNSHGGWSRGAEHHGWAMGLAGRQAQSSTLPQRLSVRIHELGVVAPAFLMMLPTS